MVWLSGSSPRNSAVTNIRRVCCQGLRNLQMFPIFLHGFKERWGTGESTIKLDNQRSDCKPEKCQYLRKRSIFWSLCHWNSFHFSHIEDLIGKIEKFEVQLLAKQVYYSTTTPGHWIPQLFMIAWWYFNRFLQIFLQIKDTDQITNHCKMSILFCLMVKYRIKSLVAYLLTTEHNQFCYDMNFHPRYTILTLSSIPFITNSIVVVFISLIFRRKFLKRCTQRKERKELLLD